jgi:hypothetical protein
MKKILQLLVLVFITNGFAQTNETSFDWSFNGGGGFNTTKRINYNSQGDLLCLMDAGHQTTFGGTTISDPGSVGFPGTVSYLCKRAKDGTSSVLIKRNVPNTTYASFHDFVIDNDDNIILTGSTFGYNSTVFYDFGNGVNLYGKGNFIAKFNPQGVCQWATLVTYGITGAMPYGENKNIGLGVLPNNDIYFANRSTNGNQPFWLLKLNPSGTEIWHKEWILNSASSVGITSSKNNFFFDNTGKAYFIIQSLYGDLVTIDGIALTPPAGAHPATSSLLTINGDGTNGVFSTYRGAIADIAVEKATGNVLLDWRQYVQNPAPFDVLPMAVNGTYQFIGIVAIDSNRNFINRTAALFTTSYGSLFPLGNLNFVSNTVMGPTETVSTPNQTFTATKYTPTWKFFENFVMTKFVAHPEINGTSTNAYDLMALYNNKLAVSGTYSLANNATVTINGTTLTSCDKDPNFATLYPSWVSLQGDVFISQLSISSSLAVVQNKLTNFQIYPNPASNQINMSFDKNLEKANLKIVSILGQTVLEKENVSGNNLNIDVSNLAKGVYVIQVLNGTSITNTKFIKQ